MPASTSHQFPLLTQAVGISDTSTIRRAPLGESAPWAPPLGGPLWGDGILMGDTWQRRGGNGVNSNHVYAKWVRY